MKRDSSKVIVNSNRSQLKAEPSAGAHWVVSLNAGSHLPKNLSYICFIENPLKVMKNVFYFILKALFNHKIFKGAWSCLRQFYDVTAGLTKGCNIHTVQYLEK